MQDTEKDEKATVLMLSMTPEVTCSNNLKLGPGRRICYFIRGLVIIIWQMATGVWVQVAQGWRQREGARHRKLGSPTTV